MELHFKSPLLLLMPLVAAGALWSLHVAGLGMRRLTWRRRVLPQSLPRALV